MITKAERHDLVRRYAEKDLSLQDLRQAGVTRFVQVLSDLSELGHRPPMADEVGPNVESRRAGRARLESILRST